jgi:hypothetical protein
MHHCSCNIPVILEQLLQDALEDRWSCDVRPGSPLGLGAVRVLYVKYDKKSDRF